jgi:hypothetical protein
MRDEVEGGRCMKTRFSLGLATLLVLSCAPGVRLARHSEALVAKPPDCELDVYEPGLLPADHSLPVVGDIYIRDTGFTVSCGKTRIRQLLHQRACEAGADAIEIYRERAPDLWSSCYRVRARLIKYSDEEKAEH